MKQLKFPIIFLIVLIFSCGKNEEKKESIPPNIIKQEKMIEMMSDMYLTDAASNMGFMKGDTDRAIYNAYYEMIFEKYDVRKTQFDSSMAFYSRDPEKMEAVYDGMLEKLSKQESEVAHDQ